MSYSSETKPAVTTNNWNRKQSNCLDRQTFRDHPSLPGPTLLSDKAGGDSTTAVKSNSSWDISKVSLWKTDYGEMIGFEGLGFFFLQKTPIELISTRISSCCFKQVNLTVRTCPVFSSTGSGFPPSHEKYSLSFWYVEGCSQTEYWDVLNCIQI